MKETIVYSKFVVKKTKLSEYIDEYLINDDEASYMICPSCRKKHPLMKHGELNKCYCGLSMQRYGNGLTIWK